MPTTSPPLRLEGHEHRHDSFTAVLRAVAEGHGRRSDYETVYAYSTNGFAPSVHPPESCRQSWFMHGRGQCLDTVAAYLGLAVEELQYPEPRPALDAAEKRPFWQVPEGQAWHARQADYLRDRIASALSAGATIITDGGWLSAPYYLWGVIHTVAPDGPVYGATLAGPRDCELDHFRHVWAVHPGDNALSREEADHKMLKHAVARIRGDAKPFRPSTELEVVWGLDAMEQWIAQMKLPHYQPDDPGSSAGNAALAATYMADAAAHTASYLRSRESAYPTPASDALERAARRYDRILQVLAPYAYTPERYASFAGDRGRQREHADTVLTEVKKALAHAANELQLTLENLTGTG